MTDFMKLPSTEWGEYIKTWAYAAAKTICFIYAAGLFIGELFFNYWNDIFVLLGRIPPFPAKPSEPVLAAPTAAVKPARKVRTRKPRKKPPVAAPVAN